MTARRPGEPGYLGPCAEAERTASRADAIAASPKRSRVTQADPASLALFAPILEPSLF